MAAVVAAIAAIDDDDDDDGPLLYANGQQSMDRYVVQIGDDDEYDDKENGGDDDDHENLDLELRQASSTNPTTLAKRRARLDLFSATSLSLKRQRVPSWRRNQVDLNDYDDHDDGQDQGTSSGYNHLLRRRRRQPHRLHRPRGGKWFNGRHFQTRGGLSQVDRQCLFHEEGTFRHLPRFELLSNMLPPANGGLPSVCAEFDPVGALICVAYENYVHVIDFDVKMTEYALDGDTTSRTHSLSNVMAFECAAKVDTMRWSPWDNDTVAIASNSRNMVPVYALGSGTITPLRQLTGTYGSGSILDLAYARTSKDMLVGATRNGELHVWDVRRSSARPWKSLSTSSSITRIQSVHTSLDGTTLVAFRNDGDIDTWDIRYTPCPLRTIPIRMPQSSSSAAAAAAANSMKITAGVMHPIYEHWVAFQMHDSTIGCFDLKARQWRCMWRPSSVTATIMDTWTISKAKFTPAFLWPLNGPPLLAAGTRLGTLAMADMSYTGTSIIPKQIAMPCVPVCITAHPTLNYVVCGYADGNFGVVGHDNNDDNDEEEETKDGGSGEPVGRGSVDLPIDLDAEAAAALAVTW